MTVRHRERWARAALWGAVFIGFIYSVTKTADELRGGGGLGPLEVLRGAGPVLLLGLGWALAPPRWRGFAGVEALLGTYLAICVLSATWSVSPASTVLKAIPLIASYLALGRLVRLYEAPDDAVRALSGVCHVIGILVALEFVFLRSHTYIATSQYDPSRRLFGVVPTLSPNGLAFVLVAGLLSLLLGVGPRWVFRSRFLVVALAAVYVVELAATRTRSALAIGVMLVLIAVGALLFRRPALVVNSTVAFAAAGLWAWSPDNVQRLDWFLRRGQDAQTLVSLTGRTDTWHVALIQWQQNRLMGDGYYAGHRLGLNGLSTNVSNIDSTWIESLVDVGILGTVPLAVALALGVCRVVAMRVATNLKVWFSLVVLYGVVISFVNPTLQMPGINAVLLGFPLLASLHQRQTAGAVDSATPEHAERSRSVETRGLRGTGLGTKLVGSATLPPASAL